MRLELGGVDHQRIGLATLIRQFQQHPGKDALLAPSFPAAVQRFVRTVFRRCITPAQAIAVDEDYPAQHPLVVDAGLAVGLWEKGLQLGHLRIAQPV